MVFHPRFQEFLGLEFGIGKVFFFAKVGVKDQLFDNSNY